MKNEECQELKNIKYKTMLLSGNKKTLNTIINDISNLDIILENETENSKKESWNRLDKSAKMNKINEYIKTLTPTYKLTKAEIETLRTYLSTNLDKKNLQRNKDVTYIKDSGILESIPSLHFNNNTRKFTLRKQSQQSALKSLGPTRKKRNKSNKLN
tara:strand:- start:80 stop:550 length:471 start_codon:yes stop_codon:yes gene_type:complete